VLFTDEAYFSTDSIITIHNQHQWAEENPHGAFEEPFSINVWPGTVGDCLIDPHFLPQWLIHNHYRDFLLHDLPKLLEDVPLAVRARMWYKHYGASAHFSLSVRNALNNTHNDRWIRREGPTAWPLRFPDLNPLGFYLAGHQKPL
jgi:hypothetical protein